MLARDPYGIKPLYYAADGRTFRFASQVKALRAGGGTTGEPDPAGEAGFYLFGSVPEPFTFYRDIHALPAGCTLGVDAAGPGEPMCYASVAGAFSPATDPVRLDGGELQARVRAALLDSVVRLAPRLGMPAAVALVSANPARAVGLADRGVVAPGRRADLVRVSRGAAPVVRTVWRAGERVA